MKNAVSAKTDFSLIELLVTVAVIAILAGLLLPALNSARQKGQAIRCVSNLKQQGNCHSLYAADFDDWIIGEQGDYGEASNYYVYYWWRKFRLLGYTGEKLRQYEDLKGPAGQNGIEPAVLFCSHCGLGLGTPPRSTHEPAIGPDPPERERER